MYHSLRPSDRETGLVHSLYLFSLSLDASPIIIRACYWCQLVGRPVFGSISSRHANSCQLSLLLLSLTINSLRLPSTDRVAFPIVSLPLQLSAHKTTSGFFTGTLTLADHLMLCHSTTFFISLLLCSFLGLGTKNFSVSH